MEKIAQKILDDAKKECERILKEKKEELSKIKYKTEQEIAKHKSETEKEYQALIEKEKNKLIGIERLKTNNCILQTKRELIDSVFDSALNSLCNKEKEEYLSLIKRLLQKAGVKSGEIIVGKDESKITDEFIDAVNKELETSFTLSQQREGIRGGFILKQETVEIDASFSTLLSEDRRNIELELSKLLFT